MKQATQQAGNCYQSAADTVADHYLVGVRELPMEEKIILVHGRPRLTRPPFIEYGHAWIEYGDMVLDTESGQHVDKKLYYMVGNIKPESCTRYTLEMVKYFINEYKHYGPWEGIEAAAPLQPRTKRRRRNRRRKPRGQINGNSTKTYKDFDGNRIETDRSDGAIITQASLSAKRAARVREEYIPKEDPGRTARRRKQPRVKKGDDSVQRGCVPHGKGRVQVQGRKRKRRTQKVSTPVLGVDDARRFTSNSR